MRPDGLLDAGGIAAEVVVRHERGHRVTPAKTGREVNAASSAR